MGLYEDLKKQINKKPVLIEDRVKAITDNLIKKSDTKIEIKKPIEKSINITLTDINRNNAADKLNKAISVINYQLGLNKSILNNHEHGEGFYYQSQRDLTEKWIKFFDDITKEVYHLVCSMCGLPVSNIITKSDVVYKGKILYMPESKIPMSQSDLDKLVKQTTKLLNKTVKAGQKIVTEAQVLGKVLEKLYKNQSVEATKIPLDKIQDNNKSFDILAERAKSYLDDEEFCNTRLENIANYAASRVSHVSNDVQDTIKDILLEGLKDGKSKSQISQELFDTLGSLNRDWRHILDTEIQNNINDSYIRENTKDATEDEAIYFQRMEVIDERTCSFCREMNGEIVKWSSIPLSDENIKDSIADKAIWEGKEWRGKKPLLATGIFHPNCRGVWIRYYPGLN